jgi:hypothetical protein
MKWGDEGLQEAICSIFRNNFSKIVDDKKLLLTIMAHPMKR